MSSSSKILLVDDEPNVLKGYERQLRNEFQLEMATGPAEALEMLSASGYAVVVSDMRMPVMDGVTFLKHVRDKWPDTVRLMLTGNNDRQTAMDAVNEGHVFRFLWKPCPGDQMARFLREALEHFRLRNAERELLATTLNESIRLMADMLSMMNPVAFGRLARIRRIAEQIAAAIPLSNAWEVEAAATLALVGCISVPEKVLVKIAQAEPLAPDEQAMFLTHPEVGKRLVARIPRLQRVADIISLQEQPWSGLETENPESDALRLEANLLKVAIDFELNLSRGLTPEAAVEPLKQQPLVYCPRLVEGLNRALETVYETAEVSVVELVDGMVLNEPVYTKTGELLVAKGHEVLPALRERLAGLLRSPRGVREPISVLRKLHLQLAHG